MKKVSKKLITSVLTLVLTVIALGTTTFAWFSISTISNVGKIEGEVRAGDGLEIQLVATSGIDASSKQTQWKSHFSATEVQTFIDSVFAGPFEAVTTEDANVENFTKAGVTNKGNIALGLDAFANVDYIEFTINFRSQQAGTVELKDLAITGDPQKITLDGDDYVQVTGKNPALLPVNASAANGARVSFDEVVFQNAESIEVDASDEVTGNTEMGAAGMIAGQYSFLTDSKGLELWDGTDEETDVKITDPTGQAILKGETTVTDGTNARVSVLLDENSTTGYHEASVTIRIWIEGWDADSYDVIYELPLSVEMTFEKKAPAP